MAAVKKKTPKQNKARGTGKEIIDDNMPGQVVNKPGGGVAEDLVAVFGATTPKANEGYFFYGSDPRYHYFMEILFLAIRNKKTVTVSSTGDPVDHYLFDLAKTDGTTVPVKCKKVTDIVLKGV